MTEKTDQIVVGFDGSPAAESALRWATDVARAASLPMLVQYRGTDEAAPAQITAINPEAEQQGITGMLRVNLAKASEHAFLVALPTRGAHAPIANVMDSTADGLLSNARGPVALVPRETFNPVGTGVVLGLDVDHPGLASIAFATKLAQRAGSPLVAVASHDDPESSLDDVQQQAEQLMAQHAGDFTGKLSVEVVTGTPAEALEEMHDRASTIVVGARGAAYRSAQADSQSRRLLRQATVPVVVVRDDA